MQLARKATGAQGVFMFCPIGMERHAHHQGVGLPILDAAADQRPTGVTLGLQMALWRGLAQQAVAHGHAGAAGAKVKGQKHLQLGRNLAWAGHHACAHACPASGDSIHDCKPSKDRAFS